MAPPAKAGDVAYWDGSKVQTCTLENYSTSMGTAVGVVVIPKGMLPDGEGRIIGMSQGQLCKANDWIVSGLPRYSTVPTTDNINLEAVGEYDYGYVPRDVRYYQISTAQKSIGDPECWYYGSTPFVPSPYLNGKMNLLYLTGAMSDVDGKRNTEILLALGDNRPAATDAANYKVDGVDIEWYLPALGELGFMISRFTAINNTLLQLGGEQLLEVPYWSSTEGGVVYDGDGMTWRILGNDRVEQVYGTYTSYVRPFAKFS